MLCSADLNRPVTIERPVLTDNGAGGSATTWTKVCTAWAKMRPARGAERFREGQLTASTMETITIRYIPNLDESWRVNFEGRLFNIRDIADLEERHIYLELSCEEGVAQ